MKIFFLCFSLLIFQLCFGQVDDSFITNNKAIAALNSSGKKIEISDYASGRLVLLVNGLILKDSITIARFFSLSKEKNAVKKVKYYSVRKTEKKFGIVNELGLVKIQVKENVLEL